MVDDFGWVLIEYRSHYGLWVLIQDQMLGVGVCTIKYEEGEFPHRLKNFHREKMPWFVMAHRRHKGGFKLQHLDKMFFILIGQMHLVLVGLEIFS